MLFDTHCHLTSKRLKKDIDEVLKKASNNGVNLIMVPGLDINDSQWSIDNLWKYDGIYGAVGIHPSVKEDCRDFLSSDEFQEMMTKSKLTLAIGETGLDSNYFDEVPFELQKERLMIQIHAAVRFRKSLILHSRGTTKEMLEVLRSEWDDYLRGRTVLHCCEADDELLKFANDRQVYVGVDGDITYSQTKQDFVKHVPRGLLVLETDAPYLLPEPMLSQKAYPNEPANLKYIAEKVAWLWEVGVEEVERVTTENARKLFGIV